MRQEDRRNQAAADQRSAQLTLAHVSFVNCEGAIDCSWRPGEGIVLAAGIPHQYAQCNMRDGREWHSICSTPYLLTTVADPPSSVIQHQPMSARPAFASNTATLQLGCRPARALLACWRHVGSQAVQLAGMAPPPLSCWCCVVCISVKRLIGRAVRMAWRPTVGSHTHTQAIFTVS